MYQSTMHPTLYTPATSAPQKLISLINKDEPGDGIWRIVMCTEDSVRERDVDAAIENIKIVLRSIDTTSPVCTYVRVRNPVVLVRILELEGVEKLTGFVIPKADPGGIPLYCEHLYGLDFKIMPILESKYMTDSGYRKMLLDVLSAPEHRDMIDCLRIGANDLLGNLGLRRDTNEFSIYDTPVGSTIHDIINEFRGNGGFTVSAPVFECFEPAYDDLLRREVRQHVLNGLFGQTVIHPRHIRVIRDLYKTAVADLDSARAILEEDAAAVTGLNGRMDEPATHAKWAKSIIARHSLFGDNLTSMTLLDKIQ